MSNERKSTKGTSEKKKQCVKEAKVTNQFKKMMDEALEATKKVLEQRKKDLSEEGWNDAKRAEFEEIFGIQGSSIISVDGEDEKKKTKAADPGSPMDPFIEIRTISAHEFVQESVERLLAMFEKISTTGNAENDDPTLNGNFFNKTHLKKGSASVTADQTSFLDPDRYKEVLKINIFQNFVCKSLMGFDSQVSTLCHELSHFYRSGENGKDGGMGTEDMPTKGGYDPNKKYYEFASILKKWKSQYVFKNSYNVEQYFEIEL
ncbi:hypothetical protein [Buttiauxella izardii]|uniref:Lysine-specific metallo-endopeptidase domain-containing protein n=1 Tax=Buttiauxella izardii TaxID=82991 RepID=A0A3A5JKV4_9ENTR|nr:hypothetical protein [Buttiauxella izardii]RJT19203.1 hypothetical protein D6029_19135 [Buttiauxella izardii]